MGEINSSFIRSGDQFQFRAETINDILQMIAQWKRGNLSGNSGMNFGDRGETIFVKNATGVDLFAGDVAAIESPLFATPEIASEDRADQYRHFLDRSYLAVLPEEGKSLAIATGPIPAGQIGRVVISGIVRAKVDVVDTDHIAVKAKAGTTELESADEGEGPISFLIKPTSTGKQWCDLVFGIASGGGGSPSLARFATTLQVFSPGTIGDVRIYFGMSLMNDYITAKAVLPVNYYQVAVANQTSCIVVPTNYSNSSVTADWLIINALYSSGETV